MKENRAPDLTFFALVTIIIQRVKRMKQKTDPLKKLLIFNALILVLSIVITINLLETGGRAVTPQATPAATQAVS
jgi:hypothetical protein